MMPAIEAVGLTKAFGGTIAVDELALTVPQGQVFGFLGPNGSGKTTTVNMLLGLVRPTAGQASILGCRPGDPTVMSRIGFLPENFRFPGWLTAHDLLDFHGRLLGMPADKRRASIPAALERVGLSAWEDTRLGSYSKGMSQRIGLAQALLGEPELVFLDEPTSALDPLGRREVRDIIRDLRAAGATVFLNSHLLSEVEVTCDRVAIVKEGRTVRVGALDELAGPELAVEVRAGGLTEDLVAGLRRWGQLGPVHGDTVRITIGDEEALPAIAAWLHEGGARIYALTPQRLSLEELFVRIVEDGSSEC